MLFNRIIASILLTASILCAGSRPLTSAEIDQAYSRAAKRIMEESPANAHIVGIEETSMVAEGSSIRVNMVVDTPNTYGVMRNYYRVLVTPRGNAGEYQTKWRLDGGDDFSQGEYGGGGSVNLSLILGFRTGRGRSIHSRRP